MCTLHHDDGEKGTVCLLACAYQRECSRADVHSSRWSRSSPLCQAITVLIGLITLILVGTVIVLSTVVQYFGVDKRDVIQDYEMALVERLANAARQLPTDGTPAQAHLSHGRVDSPYIEDTPPARDGTAQAVSSGDVKVTAGDEIGDGNSVNAFLDRLQERGWIADSTPSTEDLAKVAGKAGDNAPQQRIPKIIHATWKTHVLPERWEKVRQGCIDLHPD